MEGREDPEGASSPQSVRKPLPARSGLAVLLGGFTTAQDEAPRSKGQDGRALALPEASTSLRAGALQTPIACAHAVGLRYRTARL